MAEVTAGLVKELREKTGAGMLDCKKALLETAGDMEAAIDWLRKKGLSMAAKKSGRIASEGLVGVAVAGGQGALVEVNSETDFVARNPTFVDFVRTVSQLALGTGGDLETLKATAYPGTGRTVADEVTHLIATIGENMSLRRTAVLSVDEGVVAHYVHSAQSPGLGRMGVLVAVRSSAPTEALEAVGKKVAMHVAAANPAALSRDAVDPALLEREKNVLLEQARGTGKPEAILAKMVEGRLRKFYEEVCLLEQISVIDGETRIEKMLEAAGKELGTPVTVTGFLRFALGEGIEKPKADFAKEVADAVGN